jgi:hypothetical protein
MSAFPDLKVHSHKEIQQCCTVLSHQVSRRRLQMHTSPLAYQTTRGPYSDDGNISQASYGYYRAQARIQERTASANQALGERVILTWAHPGPRTEWVCDRSELLTSEGQPSRPPLTWRERTAQSQVYLFSYDRVHASPALRTM